MRGLIIVACALLSGGCAGNLLIESRPYDLPAAIELTNTPFYPQERYQCGPAALATILNDSGVSTDPAALVDKVYIPGKKGSYTTELLGATRSLGRIPYVIEPKFAALLAEVAAGHPVLVFQNLGYRVLPRWHYAVVIGYSTDADEILLRSGTQARETMSARRFLKSWQRGDQWAMLALRPNELPASQDADRFLQSVATVEATGHPGMAIAAYRAALERWPDNTTAMFGLGNAYYQAGDIEQSTQVYQQLVSVDPDHVAALNNLASLLSEQGQCNEAILVIRQAEQAAIDSPALTSALLQTRAEIQSCR